MTPLSPADVRALFPALRQHTWLNAAASSPLCTPVAEAMRAHLEDTVQRGDLGFGEWLKQREATRASLARFLHATPREVAFTPSTSFGFHVVAEHLRARGVTQVLTLDGEFPSTTVPLLARGLSLRVVRRRSDGSFPLADLEAALTSSTGAVAVSVVQYASGYRVDLEGLSRLCRERKLVLALNAAQALGQVPVDVQALGVDFLAGTSHKWLMAGYGTGLLYVAARRLDEGPLPMSGWLSVAGEDLWRPFPTAERSDDAAGFTVRGVRTRRDASALELGAGSAMGLCALDAALQLHHRLGPGTALAHNLRLQATLRRELRARGFAPNTPDEPATGSGICVVPVQGSPEDAVKALLREAQVVTTPRGGGLRLSTHVFNDEEDVARLLWGLERVGLQPGP